MVFKISNEGEDVSRAPVDKLVVDPVYPHWKCDLAPEPKHFGYIDASVSVSAGQTKVIFSLPHEYKYKPTFLVAWNYAPGEFATDSTYGIGDFTADIPSDLTIFKTKTTDTDFIITADNTLNSGAITDVSVKFRFYIFAEDLPTYNYIVVLGENNL